MNRKLTRTYDLALRDLRRLIALTDAAVEKCAKRGDAAALASLIDEQRHNLKVLLRNLRRMDK